MKKISKYIKKNINIIKNIINLYGFTIAKVLFPLITLPYLTRVLSVSTYGVVTYVKGIMSYVQTLVDFGFNISGVKDIASDTNKENNIKKISSITISKCMISLISIIMLFLISIYIPILKNNILFTFLSFLPVFLSIFLFDFYFRGIEKMEIVTVKYIVLRTISTLLTVTFIKSDKHIIYIPIFDIISSLLAIIYVEHELKKDNIHIKRTSVNIVIDEIKNAFIYFVSSFSTTVFGALNTLLIGIFLDETSVAYWSINMQLISVIQTMYQPIIDGIYPDMVKNKKINKINIVLSIFIPTIIVGCIISYFLCPYVLYVFSGNNYVSSAYVFRLLIPTLIFGFTSMLLGWPTLGVFGTAKQVTLTTFISASFQITCLVILALKSKFTLQNVSITRSLTEIILTTTRLFVLIMIIKKQNPLK